MRDPSTIKVIIGCECSQVIMSAFLERGFDAYSCDLKDCEGPRPDRHIKGDVTITLMDNYFDLGIFHPPCTYLTFAGKAYWNRPGRVFQRIDALRFFAELLYWKMPHVCVENPMGIADAVVEHHSQEIHPYFFGDGHIKRTCLWLKNLPKLVHTKTNNLFEERTHIDKPPPIYIRKDGKAVNFADAVDGHSKNASAKRSVSFPGIGKAMAEQWGNYLINKS